MSLLKNPEEHETSDDGSNDSDKKPAVRWHKVRLVLKSIMICPMSRTLGI